MFVLFNFITIYLPNRLQFKQINNIGIVETSSSKNIFVQFRQNFITPLFTILPFW